MDARKQRDKARELANGTDPSQQRTAEKLMQEAAAESAFKIVSEAWYAQWAPTRDLSTQTGCCAGCSTISISRLVRLQQGWFTVLRKRHQG